MASLSEGSQTGPMIWPTYVGWRGVEGCGVETDAEQYSCRKKTPSARQRFQLRYRYEYAPSHTYNGDAATG